MDMQSCISKCHECHQVCLETLTYCLEKGGKHAEGAHVRILMDCALICELSADFIIRKSPFGEQACNLCGDICEKCAESCESIGDDEQMRRCAEVCRQCAESCRESAPGCCA